MRYRGLFCPRCGYGLTGLVRQSCPECGRRIEFDPKLIGCQKDHGWHGPARVMGAAIVVAVVGTSVPLVIATRGAFLLVPLFLVGMAASAWANRQFRNWIREEFWRR
ncbi:MAG: hypothetical protein CMJ18_12385 [Phycisphaeraceae bacterium]|nr:hypothetical protein [Phycisphaeraceae bacterium]